MKRKFYTFFILLLSGNWCFSQTIKHWTFDENPIPPEITKDVTFQEGIKNNAALFNGFTSEWTEDGFTDLNTTFYIHCWIALQEYSFNQSAIVNQQNNYHSGFFFGINHLGELVGSIASEGRWLTCISESKIPLLKWSHVAMVFDRDKGIKLYIDGKPEGELKMKMIPTFAPKVPLVIGKNQMKMSPANTERTTSMNQKSWMRFDGLIDELIISANIPADKEIIRYVKEIDKVGEQVFEYRKMPSGKFGQGAFGAYYTRLMYAPGWEKLWKVSEYPDVVVRFPDSPVKFIFWRGTGYSPSIVTENDIWVCDQSAENFASGECYEVMSDKQCRYSHVRIIESTPARCVVHWRYALTGIKFDIYREDVDGWGEWVDEYWTIFPDGVAARKEILHSDSFKNNKGGYQLQSTMFFSQPGTRPQDNATFEALEFIDFEGNKALYSWEKEAPRKYDKTRYQPIQLLRLNAEHDMFCIFPPENRSTAMQFGWAEGYSNFSSWDHWPITQNKSDGRVAYMSDRAAHTCITDVNGRNQLIEYGSDNTVIARQLLGMT